MCRSSHELTIEIPSQSQNHEHFQNRSGGLHGYAGRHGGGHRSPRTPQSFSIPRRAGGAFRLAVNVEWDRAVAPILALLIDGRIPDASR